MANMSTMPRTEFAAALSQVATERGIDVDQIIESIKIAVVTAYRKDFGGDDEKYLYDASVDPSTGETHIFRAPIDNPEKKENITPPGYGRIAAQQARNVIIQKIREAEKNAILDDYSTKVGTLVSGMVLRFDGDNAVIDLGKGEGIMPPSEQNREEQYRLNQKLIFYVEGIRETMRGRQIILSRAHEGLIAGLFKREVPEINSGAVEIVTIAREAGSRTKIAVSSNQPGVDPVGSCVGQRGVRVQAVIGELGGEKIDIVQYNDDLAKFIASALSPAEGLTVKLSKDRDTATVMAPIGQLSLAIGKGGQNVRLAIKLTKVRLDIEGDGSEAVVPEKTSEKTIKPAKAKKPKKPSKTSKTSKSNSPDSK